LLFLLFVGMREIVVFVSEGLINFSGGLVLHVKFLPRPDSLVAVT